VHRLTYQKKEMPDPRALEAFYVLICEVIFWIWQTFRAVAVTCINASLIDLARKNVLNKIL
jgi:hypothetical protein